jgi:hypothetical protein
MKNYNSSVHHTAAAEGGDHDDSAASPDTVMAPPPITQEQYAQLMLLLQSSTANHAPLAASNQVRTFQAAGPSSAVTQGKISLEKCLYSSVCHNIALDTWIIDSGASHHICASLHWFHSYSEINPMIVKLPNGNHVVTKYAGTVKFSSLFSISGVLYVPSFNVNLISVSLLCDVAQCIVRFTDTYGYVQEQKSLKMIGLAEKKDGLYHLIQSDKSQIPSSLSLPNVSISANNVYLSENALWHFRFGHLSNSRLALLKSIFPSVTFDSNTVCDICHFAKHRKLPFVQSYHKAIKPFDMIHFDIWGPISIKSIHHHSYFLTAVDDHSRYTWITLMKTKSETRMHVQNFIKFIEIQHRCCQSY